MTTKLFHDDTKPTLSSLGKAPGELIDYDINDTLEAKIYHSSYSKTDYQRSEIDSLDDINALRVRGHINWIQVIGYDINIIESIGRQLNIHPLVLEDINERSERPKIQSTDNYCFITLNSYFYSEERKKVIQTRFSLLLFKDLLITFHDLESKFIPPILNRLKQGLGQIRQNGADYLAYVMLDGIVDQLFFTLQIIGEKLDDIEIELSNKVQDNLLPSIHRIKHQLILMRRGIWPLRELFASLLRDGDEHHHFTNHCTPFLRDLYDHYLQAAEISESLREETISLIDLYLNSIANNLNQVMKILSIIGTIFLPLTFITSLYGMNFKDMPELNSPYGYPVVIGIMLIIAGVMLTFFKKKKWL